MILRETLCQYGTMMRQMPRAFQNFQAASILDVSQCPLSFHIILPCAMEMW